MADQNKITLRTTHATPNNIILRELPVADVPAGTTIRLYAGHATPNNIILRDPTVTDSPGGFPTQYSGFKIKKGSGTIELCLVAEADAPSGMGGVFKIRVGGGLNRALYLVETTDPNASPLRIRTGTGTKAVRLKT